MDEGHTSWLDNELAGCHLADKRLTKRRHKLLGLIGGAMGQSIPFACQDWANAKAAYRFLSNDRLSEGRVCAARQSCGDLLEQPVVESGSLNEARASWNGPLIATPRSGSSPRAALMSETIRYRPLAEIERARMEQ
jgi:hypothetical protein